MRFIESLKLIDKTTFLGSVGLLLVTVVPLLIWPVQGAEWTATAKMLMTEKLGFLYLILGVAATFFMI